MIKPLQRAARAMLKNLLLTAFARWASKETSASKDAPATIGTRLADDDAHSDVEGLQVWRGRFLTTNSMEEPFGECPSPYRVGGCPHRHVLARVGSGVFQFGLKEASQFGRIRSHREACILNCLELFEGGVGHFNSDSLMNSCREFRGVSR